MSRWEQAVVRVWQGKPTDSQSRYKGTAFLIAPGHLVTAKHVIQDVPQDAIYLQGPPWSGGLRRVGSVAQHPDRDIAVLSLAQPDPRVACIPLARSDPQAGERVVLGGYATPDRDLDQPVLEISSYDGVQHTFVLHTYVAQGMSGGPALRNGRLVGVTQARDTDRNRAYVIPLSAFRDFILPYARRERRVSIWVAGLLLVGLLGLGGWFIYSPAQQQILEGSIWDESNNPLPGVHVSLPVLGVTGTTDLFGRFRLRVQAPYQATVELMARKDGYQTYEQYATLGNTGLSFMLRRRE